MLVTEDKDFGEPVFLRDLSHPYIVRFGGLTAAEEVAVMRDLIEQRKGTAMRKGEIIVVTGRRVRVRSARNVERSND